MPMYCLFVIFLCAYSWETHFKRGWYKPALCTRWASGSWAIASTSCDKYSCAIAQNVVANV